MRWQSALVVFLAVVTFSGPITAAIFVPDPSWIAGFWDGGDGDEAVSLVWDRSSGTTPVVARPSIELAVLASVEPEPVPPVPLPRALEQWSRAPPLS